MYTIYLMPMRTHPELARIQAYFALSKQSVFRPRDLDHLLGEVREQWSIPRSYGRDRFLLLLKGEDRTARGDLSL
jgi:hypothetical protein